MKSLRTSCLAALAVVITSLPAWAGDPSGSWKFTAEGPNGRTVDSTLILKWKNNRLTGQIDNRAGQVDISAASFAGEQVTFTVVRKIRRKELTIHYAGKLEGDTITGTIQTTGRDKKPVSLPWTATRGK
jgi:hypothetical protein